MLPWFLPSGHPWYPIHLKSWLTPWESLSLFLMCLFRQCNPCLRIIFNYLIVCHLVNCKYFLWGCGQKSTEVPSFTHWYVSWPKQTDTVSWEILTGAYPFLQTSSKNIPHHQHRGVLIICFIPCKFCDCNHCLVIPWGKDMAPWASNREQQKYTRNLFFPHVLDFLNKQCCLCQLHDKTKAFT